jgi:hypothetical protein
VHDPREHRHGLGRQRRAGFVAYSVYSGYSVYVRREIREHEAHVPLGLRVLASLHQGYGEAQRDNARLLAPLAEARNRTLEQRARARLGPARFLRLAQRVDRVHLRAELVALARRREAGSGLRERTRERAGEFLGAQPAPDPRLLRAAREYRADEAPDVEHG